MFKIIRINRKFLILLFLLFVISNLFTLTFLSHTYLNIDDDSDISDRIATEPVSLKSSSTIESTEITKEYQYSNDFVVNMPSVRPDGDLYIAQIVMNEDPTITTIPSGWTEIENWYQAGPGQDVRLATYWKIGSSELATYTWSSEWSVLWVGAIHRISGFDLNNPIHKSNISRGESANPIAPSVTTTIDECLILRMFGADDNNTVTDWPSGTTPIFQEDLGSDSIMSAAAYHSQTLAGNTGTAQFTMGGADRWVAITIAINPGTEENIPPIYSNLTESADPLELGETETIRINTSDPSGIKQVRIIGEGFNESMTHISGDMWQYEWIPSSIGSKSYTIWMEDNYNNWNSTSGSIMVIDTIAPTYSDLIESADPLPLGQNETISIKVFDSSGSGVNQVILEYDSSNHTMKNVTNTWSWSNWRPLSEGTYTYKIYMQDNQNNWNATDIFNITVITTTAPIIGNITESADPLELGNNITITVDVFDDVPPVSIVLIELMGVNYTMNNTGGNTFEHTWTRSTVGIFIYTIHANDTENNWNKYTSSFDIVDTTSPNYANLTESLGGELELGDTLIVAIDTFDLSGIEQVRIEYEGKDQPMSIIGGNTWQHGFWTPSSTGIHIYTISIEDFNNNWNFTTGNITVQDTISPRFSDLIESGDPIELGTQLTIMITVSDLADIKSVLLECEGSNHTMANIGGQSWQYNSWMPNRVGNYSYAIYMEDNNNNHNSTNGSIEFQDTISPVYSDLIESADPLELGDVETITIEIDDFSGINKSLIEFEGSNHTMTNIYGNVYQYNTWTPSNWTVYQYSIHIEDNSGNSNVTSGNITVQDTTPPSQPIFTNAPSGDVSGVLTFDWIDGSDPSGISYYVLMIDNESNPYITPGYVFMSNITNIGSESSYYELHESIPSGSYYYFLIQIDGVGHQSSYTTGTFTMISVDIFFVIIGIIFASVIGSITTIVIVKRRIKKDSLPRRKKIPLKIILSHIDNISDSSQSSEKIAIQKVKKQKENKKTNKQKKVIKDKELMARISKIKIYGEKLFKEGAYLEAQKQFEFAEKILLKLGKKEEALLFSDLTVGIKELREERNKKLEIIEKEKLGNDSLKIFEIYYDLIELSKKLKDYDSASMYLSELTQFYETDQKKLRDLEYQRFNLYKQANSLIEEKKFEKSAGFYEKCEKISQFLVQIGRENEKKNVEKFREKIKDCLNRASQK